MCPLTKSMLAQLAFLHSPWASTRKQEVDKSPKALPLLLPGPVEYLPAHAWVHGYVYPCACDFALSEWVEAATHVLVYVWKVWWQVQRKGDTDMPYTVLHVSSHGVWQTLQSFAERADRLALWLWGKSRVPGRWRVLFAILHELEDPSNNATALLLQIIDLLRPHIESLKIWWLQDLPPSMLDAVHQPFMLSTAACSVWGKKILTAGLHASYKMSR